MIIMIIVIMIPIIIPSIYNNSSGILYGHGFTRYKVANNQQKIKRIYKQYNPPTVLIFSRIISCAFKQFNFGGILNYEECCLGDMLYSLPLSLRAIM